MSIKSRDEIIRCVDVRNSEGEIYKRSVQTLHLLEMDSDESLNDSEIEEQVEEQVEAEPHVTPYNDRVNNSDSNIPDSVNDSSLNNSNLDFSGFIDPASDLVTEDHFPEEPSLGPTASAVTGQVDVGSIQQDQTEAGPMAEHGQDSQPIHRGNSNVVKTRSGRVSKPRDILDL